MEILLTGDPLTRPAGLRARAGQPGRAGRRAARAAQALAERIAANAPLSVLAAKRTVYLSAEHPLTEAYDEAERIWEPVYRSDDAQEGPAAFRDKRTPGLDGALTCPPTCRRCWPTWPPRRPAVDACSPGWTPAPLAGGPPRRSAGPSPTRSPTWPTSTNRDAGRRSPTRSSSGPRRRAAAPTATTSRTGWPRAPALRPGTRCAWFRPARARAAGGYAAVTRPPGCRGSARTWAWPPRSRPGSWRPGRTARTSPTPSGSSGRRPRRLRHVAHIGIRALPLQLPGQRPAVPAEPIRVELTAPDGETWTWGPAEAADRVTGPALDFCLVVTQRRHRADTSLVVTGPVATPVDDDRAGVRRPAGPRPRTRRGTAPDAADMTDSAARPATGTDRELSGFLRRPRRRLARDGRRRPDRRPHRRLPGRADHADPVEGPAEGPGRRLRPVGPGPARAGARHLPGPRHKDRQQRRRPQPGRPGRPAGRAGRTARPAPEDRLRRRRRPAAPAGRADRGRARAGPPGHRPAPGPAPRQAGHGQRLPGWLGHHRRAGRRGGHRGLPPGHRRFAGHRPGRVVARLAPRTTSTRWPARCWPGT